MSQTQLEKIVVKLPLVFSKVSLPPEKDVKGRKKVLSEYNGRVVLLSNEHSGDALHMGRLKTDKDEQCYHFQKIKPDGSFIEIREWYNDLSELYVGSGLGINMQFNSEK